MNMRMIKPLLLPPLAVLALGVPQVNAQAPAQSQPAASDAETDQFYGAMQERYRLMQEQMQRIRQTKDPKERQRLMREHWQTVHEGVGMMGGGWGMGHGMMGGYGMGPGMMGGYGMGQGMMGGSGMGSGMGGYGMGPQGLSDLSDEQRTRIAKIRDETRKKHWDLMGKMMDEQARLRDLYDAPKRDSDAIANAHKKISELQRRMYEDAADAHKRMESVLTKEQKEQQEKSWRFWRNW